MSSRLALLLGAGTLATLRSPAIEPPANLVKRRRTPPRSYSPNYWRFGGSPKVSRHWHDPKDPVQARRIAAAKAKRARKAAKLDRDIFECARRNLTHRHPVPGTRRVDALNPIFIAQ